MIAMMEYCDVATKHKEQPQTVLPAMFDCIARQAPPKVMRPPNTAAGAGAFTATMASKAMAITMSRFHTSVLMAGVVPVKDLYHMACVKMEKEPRQSASNQVQPKVGKFRRRGDDRWSGAMANSAQELCTTRAALKGDDDK
eukprot:Skav224778  [mRNA]  locus=scaffold4598:37999:41141:- [translate_table: standard]